jgi:ferredoxin-NADP reductase
METKSLKLLGKRSEAGNVRTFVFETGGLNWIAGQSQGYILRQAGDTEDEFQRWFTIASAPVEGTIHISTRISDSGFKRALDALQVGDEIESHSLEGDFTWEEHDGKDVVLVAGGIGVTPFHSIFLERHAAAKPLNARLLYYNRTEEVPFREEFAGLQANHPELSIEILVGEQISADSILSHAPESSGSLVYLSGPEPMVESVGSDLKDRGIQIKQDWFPGYDEKTF